MIHTIQQAKNANERAGFHFFDAASMRFFGSRLPRKVYPVSNGALFVTSEQRPTSYSEETAPRLFTIRFAHDNGRVETVGEFQEWSSRTDADRFARNLAREWCDSYLADYVNPKNGMVVPVAVLVNYSDGRVKLAAVSGTWRVFTGDAANLANIQRFDGETGEVAR